ncbi:hypothetical protein E2542_SST09449 [Spatholobus suberectus]|nr:hypothetical protein E2542_SST09449 [Spatholobus suberectus]
MLALLDTGQQVEPETTHGFKPLESFSTPKPSHLKPPRHPSGMKMLTISNSHTMATILFSLKALFPLGTLH